MATPRPELETKEIIIVDRNFVRKKFRFKKQIQKFSAISVWPAIANIHLYTYIYLSEELYYIEVYPYSFTIFLNVKLFLWKAYFLMEVLHDDCDDKTAIILNPAKFRNLYFHRQKNEFLHNTGSRNTF